MLRVGIGEGSHYEVALRKTFLIGDSLEQTAPHNLITLLRRWLAAIARRLVETLRSRATASRSRIRWPII